MADKLKKPAVTLSNEKSMFANVEKKPTKQDLEKNVRESLAKENDFKERAATLLGSFNKIFQDKTLPLNKTIFAKDLERELISKLSQFGIDLNNASKEEEEQDGMGSSCLINLLLGCVLMQRDRMNQMEYSLSELEKKLRALDKPAGDA